MSQMNCTGQRPLSDVVATLSPNSISSTGHIKVKPNLQIADDSLPNIYICGDVADTNTPNPNARSAMRQGTIVADNILRAAAGKPPSYIYENQWADGVIKLTLGLVCYAPKLRLFFSYYSYAVSRIDQLHISEMETLNYYLHQKKRTRLSCQPWLGRVWERSRSKMRTWMLMQLKSKETSANLDVLQLRKKDVG